MERVLDKKDKSVFRFIVILSPCNQHFNTKVYSRQKATLIDAIF